MSLFPWRPRGAGPAPGWTRQLVRWLTGSLLASSSFAGSLPFKPSQPYLAVVAPVPLRFAPPPPDLSTEPAPAAPPNPDGVVGDIAQSNQDAAASEPSNLPLTESSRARVAAKAPSTQPTESAPRTSEDAPELSILPDERPRIINPEDVLPFFLPPSLPSAPPSQATYRLK